MLGKDHSLDRIVTRDGLRFAQGKVSFFTYMLLMNNRLCVDWDVKSDLVVLQYVEVALDPLRVESFPLISHYRLCGLHGAFSIISR